jgi:hypothetical protein
LSFGSETGRTRSGTKSFSSKEKKQKKKKQEFHSHRRAHFQESERLDPNEVRARTILALDKLGHQVISTEPGGYDLRAWLRSLNSLLDDFQEKVGTDPITDEFLARRQEANLSLVPQTASEGVDQELEKLNQEEEAAREALAEVERKVVARRTSLKEERDACVKELKAERERLAGIKEARKIRPFFSRVLNTGPSTEQADARVAELEVKLKELEEEIDRPRSAQGEADSAQVEAMRRLEDVEKRLADLHSNRQARLQLANEREVAAQKISGAISSMKFDQAATQGG